MLRRQLLLRRDLANRSLLLHPLLHSSSGRAWQSLLLRPPFRSNRNNRSSHNNRNNRGSAGQSRRGHRNYRPFQSRVRVLQSLWCRLLLRSHRLQTFGRASRSRCNRQRKLRRRGPQRLPALKSQRSKSSLNFGRLLCRV